MNHFNHDYDGGSPNLPVGVGDRYYGQDRARDFWYPLSESAKSRSAIYKSFPVLLTNPVVTQGGSVTQVNIAETYGIVEYDITVPDDFSLIPPTDKTETIKICIKVDSQTNYNMGTATFDGVTVNYLKASYSEVDGSSRSKAKKAGTYVYEKTPSYTLAVNSTPPTDKDLLLATIVGDGSTFLTIGKQIRTPKITDEYDYTVNSQEDFNQIIKRDSANVYSFLDQLNSVKFTYLSGGYQCAGGTSFLTGGDTWAKIETNNCKHISFNSGVFLDAQSSESYIEINTDFAILDNVEWQGNAGSGGGAEVLCFDLNASDITLQNCSVKNRRFTASPFGRGSFNGQLLSDSQKSTCKILNCKMENIEANLSSGNYYAFRELDNITNCYIKDLSASSGFIGFQSCNYISQCKITSSTVLNTSTMFRGCTHLSSCIIKDIDSNTPIFSFIGFENCDDISSCTLEEFTSTSSVDTFIGFSGCNKIFQATIYDITITTCPTFRGFYNSDDLSDCKIEDLSLTTVSTELSGFNNCKQLSNCLIDELTQSGSYFAYGFTGCENLSNCKIATFEVTGSGPSSGFITCVNLSNCIINNISFTGSASSYGFNQCEILTNCLIDTISTNTTAWFYGFSECNFLSSCVAINGDVRSNLSVFITCKNLSSCIVKDISLLALYSINGFLTCEYLSSCGVDNLSAVVLGSVVESFDSCKGLTSCSVYHPGGSFGSQVGFQDCSGMQSNKAALSGSGYPGSTADFGSTQNCADTSAGGYNG